MGAVTSHKLLRYLESLRRFACTPDSPQWAEQKDRLAALAALAQQFLGAEAFAVLLVNTNYESLDLCMGTPTAAALVHVCNQHLLTFPPHERFHYLTQEGAWQMGDPLPNEWLEREAASLAAAAYMRFPLRLDGQPIGLVVIAAMQSVEWGEWQLRLGRALALSTESLLENTLWYYRSLRLDALQQAAFKMAQLINEDIELNQVLDQAVSEMIDLTQARGGEILLISADHKHIELAVGKGQSRIQNAQQRAELGVGLVGQVALHRQSIRIEDYQTFEHALPSIVEHNDLASAMGVPLIRGEELVGVAAVFHMREDAKQPFTEDDLEMLEGLAPLAAMAIEKAQLRDTVRQERQQIQVILDHIPLPLMLFDTHLRLILANPAAHKAVGRLDLSLYDYVGKSFNRLRKALALDISFFQSTPIGDAFEVNLGAAGEFIIYVAQAVGLRGRVEGYVVVAEEVTEERQLNRARSELLYILSHDLGNILSLALGYTSLMLEDPVTGEEYITYVRRIFEALTRAKALIRDVVEIEYAKTHGLQIAKPYYLEEALQNVVRDMQALAALQNQTLTFTVIKNPPQELVGNVSLIRQAFENLVTNAIKYTPGGGEITIILDSTETDAIVTVSDTGIGIPADQLPLIWDRFYRVNSEQVRSIQGLGLGLNLVRSVIQAHQGRIEVESEVGKGSTFRVYLPLVIEQPQPANP